MGVMQSNLIVMKNIKKVSDEIDTITLKSSFNTYYLTKF